MKSGLSVILLVLLATAGGCRPHPVTEVPRPVVRYESTRRLDDVRDRAPQTYIGIIRGEMETDLSFKVGGTLDLIGPEPGRNWGEGDSFRKDQVLAQLNQVEYKSQYDLAKARADLARTQFESNEQLFREKAVSQREFDTFKASLDENRAILDRATQELRDSTLRAPFAGRVLGRPLSSGETVMPGRPVLRIADLSVVSIEFGVPDRLVNQITNKQTFPLVVSAIDGRKFQGVVSEVGVAAKDGSRLFKVVMKVDNPSGELRSGMTATATFEESVRPPDGAVLVRLSALVASSKARPAAGQQASLAVFVVGDGGVVEEREVETGDLIRNMIVVTRGVRPGDKVVIVGAPTLHAGERVDARPQDPDARD